MNGMCLLSHVCIPVNISDVFLPWYLVVLPSRFCQQTVDVILCVWVGVGGGIEKEMDLSN